LCDVFGNAVGMVTAKTAGGSGVESYGMALPADVLRTFLARHLAEKGLAPPRPSAVGLEWDQVDRLVSPSVLMVLRAPR
jgi:S1-C subfamily serine protease